MCMYVYYFTSSMWIPFVHRKCKVCLLESSGISYFSNISHRYWVEGRTSWCSHFAERLEDTEDPVLFTMEQAWTANRWVGASMGQHFLCPITPHILGKGHKIVSWSKIVCNIPSQHRLSFYGFMSMFTAFIFLSKFPEKAPKHTVTDLLQN